MAAGGRQASPPQMNPPTPGLAVRCPASPPPLPLPVRPRSRSRSRHCGKGSADPRTERAREGGGASGAGAGRRGRGSYIRVLRRAGGRGRAVTSSAGWGGGRAQNGGVGVVRGRRDF